MPASSFLPNFDFVGVRCQSKSYQEISLVLGWVVWLVWCIARARVSWLIPRIPMSSNEEGHLPASVPSCLLFVSWVGLPAVFRAARLSLFLLGQRVPLSRAV